MKTLRTTMLLVALMLLAVAPLSMAKDADNLPNYELVGAGTGNQGTYLVKVTVISKKNKVDDATLGRCAVHGVLFKGFTKPEGRGMERPLAGSALNLRQHADFYKDFFAPGGTSEMYVGAVSLARQTVKSGKEYKISTVVTVNKEQLLKDLQSAGIVKGLTDGF